MVKVSSRFGGDLDLRHPLVQGQGLLEGIDDAIAGLAFLDMRFEFDTKWLWKLPVKIIGNRPEQVLAAS